MNSRILALDVSGAPRCWISLEDAVTYHAKNQVAWQFGDNTFQARGGYQKNDLPISSISILGKIPEASRS